MTLDIGSLLPKLVEEANLAPSVHNTQPAKWRLEKDGLVLFLDRSRLLKIGDPCERDGRLSCGAAMEGMRLALSRHGMDIHGHNWISGDKKNKLEPIVKLDLKEVETHDPLSNHTEKRFTWRGGFTSCNRPHTSFLSDEFAKREDVELITSSADIDLISDMNDEASLFFFQNELYREELTQWMRFNLRDENWSRDGLNARSLCLGRFDAEAAKVFLGSRLFDILDKLRLSQMLISEKAKTRTSTAIMLFHRSIDEEPAKSGIAYYRALLELASAGLMTWPMAVLADGEEWRSELVQRYHIPADRRLVNVIRIGVAPRIANIKKARLPASELIV